MLLHDDFLKKFNYKEDRPRAVVPASTTADELQEIVSQAIWEWGVDKKFLNDDAIKLEKDVLQSAFVAMAIGGNRMDSGKNKAKSWLTPGSKEYLIRSKISNGALKLSKALFTEGLYKELSIKVPWANVDNLWRRIMEEYPDNTVKREGNEGGDRLSATNPRPATLSPTGSGLKITGSSKKVRPQSAGAINRSSSNNPLRPSTRETLPRSDGGSNIMSTTKKKKKIKKSKESSHFDDDGISEVVKADEKYIDKQEEKDMNESIYSTTTKDIFGSSIGEGDLLFGTRWKERLEKAEQERIAKNKRFERQQRQREKSKKVGTNATKMASGGGYDFSSIEVANKTKCSHITFVQFEAAFTSHAKHRDNITRRNKIGANTNQLHGTEHIVTKEDKELDSVNRKAKAKLNESDENDVDWMAGAYRLVMDAFDRDKLLLHEAFFAFDVAGDGAVSLGEFVGVLTRMKPKLPVTKKQMFAMFMALDVKCARKVRLLEFVTFFLTLYDKKLRTLCEEHTNLAKEIYDIEDSIHELEVQIEEKKKHMKKKKEKNEQLKSIVSKFNGVLKNEISNKQHDQEEEEGGGQDIVLNEKTLNQLIQAKQQTEEARDQVKETMRYTSTVVASAVDLLNIELAPPNEQYHGTYAAGISKYIPGTGKGSIAEEYMFREDAARIGARHRARDNRRETRMNKLTADAEEVDESWDVEVIIDTEQEMREEKGRRTRRIHEMLARRVFQKNQILPIKQQILGSTYKKSDDPMQWAVEAGKHQLKIEIIDRKNGAVEAANEIDLLKDNIQHVMVKNTHHKDITNQTASSPPISTSHNRTTYQVNSTTTGTGTTPTGGTAIGASHGTYPTSTAALHRRLSLHTMELEEDQLTSSALPSKDTAIKKDGDDGYTTGGVTKIFGRVDNDDDIVASDNKQPQRCESEEQAQVEKVESKISETESLSIDGKVLAKALQRDTTHKLLHRRETVLSPPLKARYGRKPRGVGTVSAGLYMGQRGGEENDDIYGGGGGGGGGYHGTNDEHESQEDGDGGASIGSKTLLNLMGTPPNNIKERSGDPLSKLKDLNETPEMNISTAEGLLPGRYAHVIRKVGMSDASVRREMLSLHLKTPELENLHHAATRLMETQLAVKSPTHGNQGVNTKVGSMPTSPLKALKKWQQATNCWKQYQQKSRKVSGVNQALESTATNHSERNANREEEAVRALMEDVETTQAINEAINITSDDMETIPTQIFDENESGDDGIGARGRGGDKVSSSKQQNHSHHQEHQGGVEAEKEKSVTQDNNEGSIEINDGMQHGSKHDSSGGSYSYGTNTLINQGHITHSWQTGTIDGDGSSGMYSN